MEYEDPQWASRAPIGAEVGERETDARQPLRARIFLPRRPWRMYLAI